VKSCEFSIRPIGVIRTPYAGVEDDVPIQGRLASNSIGEAHIYPEFQEGLRDLEGFSHVFLLYVFHRTTVMKMIARPYLDKRERGIFAIRSPHRPNRIGLTLVKLLSIESGVMKIAGVDMVDGTPLVDIKPYNPKFDRIENDEKVRTGWMDDKAIDDYGFRVTTSSRKQWLHEE
jgi:tRNA-Thr(GGU) m(6)t(6)A37 methyltransferase TsaA